MRIKVIAASCDKDVQKKLEEADFSGNKMELCAFVRSDEELFEECKKLLPELVIIDRNLGKADTLSCIRKLKELKSRCHILAVGEKDDTEFMHFLFEIKVDGYLSKPLELEAVNRELKGISENIRRITLDATDYDTAVAMQALYFWKIMFEDRDIIRDIKFINRTLESKFREGCFRVVLCRIDQYKGEIPDFEKVDYYDDLHRIQQYIKASTSQYLYEYCYEMLFDFTFNGVLTILNYDRKYNSVILEQFDQLQEDIYKFSLLNYGMTVTMCVGGEYEDFSKVSQSREEAYSVAWSRMKQGTGKILYYHKKYDIQQLYREQLEQLVADLRLTADTLNAEDFHRTVELLFSLPDYILADYNFKDYLLGFVDEFFVINGDVLARHIKVEQEQESIKKTLNFCNTLERYRKNFETRLGSMFEILGEDAEKQNIRQLRKAVQYIKQNYDKAITAETLASMVNLSPVYFSYLFKKNMGMNMTDYITECRMETAKKQLLETDMTIYEIAVSVGFQDQRYFSKRFKQIVGKTPTEYRKMK